jgi:probable F420-dependent oxidoreductase
MEAGVAYFATPDGVQPDELARLVEERGHPCLFFPEHTHIPAHGRTPWPGGGRLPRKYSHAYDLFVAMTAAALATTRLRVASGICLVIQRDPITTAKAVASIDHLSGGRVEFGVGAGWNREEMMNHGTDPRVRMRVLQERVEAMKLIWTQEEASYNGEFVAFDRILSWPKPVQRPHPPVLIGGNGPTVLDRVLSFGDGWLPNYDQANLHDRLRELRTRTERAVSVTVMKVPADPRALEEMELAGVQRVVHWLPSAGRGPIERALDRYERAIAQLHGEWPPQSVAIAKTTTDLRWDP